MQRPADVGGLWQGRRSRIGEAPAVVFTVSAWPPRLVVNFIALHEEGRRGRCGAVIRHKTSDHQT